MTSTTNQHYSQTIPLNTNVQNLLSNRELELYELSNISGIKMDPHLFRILIELLKLEVSPLALFEVLHTMATQLPNPSLVIKKNSQNKESSYSSLKKKPPVAAKPKKIRVESANIAY